LLQYSKIEKSPEEIEKLAIPFHANLHNVGDHNHYCMYFLGTADREEFVRNEESKDMKWFSEEEIKNSSYLLPSIKKMALYALELYEKITK